MSRRPAVDETSRRQDTVGDAPLERLAASLAAGGAALRERAPHVATRVVVDVDGQSFVRDLYAAFDESNRAHFGGALSPPLILVTYTAPRALGDHAARDPHGLRSVIRLHPRVAASGARFARDILAHEMVHTWAVEVANDSEPGYRGHGPKFAGMCNTIGRALGLAEVGLKGRKGLPDCAQWPVCVRPPGYYGTAGAELERGKRARPKASPAAEGASGATSPASGRRPPRELAIAAAACERAAEIFGERTRPLEQTVLARSAVLLRELAAEATGA